MCIVSVEYVEFNLFPQDNYVSGTQMCTTTILYMNIMIKVEMGKVEVQYLHVYTAEYVRSTMEIRRSHLCDFF